MYDKDYQKGRDSLKEEKKKNHLPTYGVGPVYVCFIICLTIAGAVLSK